MAPAPKKPNSQKGFIKAILKASEAGVRLVVADFLVQEFFVLAEVREGQVMKFLQQDKRYSLFCKLLPLYEWNPKDHSLENKMSCIFQAVCNIINSKQKQ